MSTMPLYDMLAGTLEAVGFTGTSGIMTGIQETILRDILESAIVGKGIVVFHGGCIGVDRFVHNLCLRHGVLVEVFPSSKHDHWVTPPATYAWGRVHEPAPPLKRNRIIAERTVGLVAVPATETEVLRSGTWSTVRYARKVNKPVVLLLPSGAVKLERIYDDEVVTHPADGIVPPDGV